MQTRWNLRIVSIITIMWLWYSVVFFYVYHCYRDLQKHLLHWCALVPLWCPEMWPEVWLLDVWGLVSGLTDVGGWYLQLHPQRRVGSHWWEWADDLLNGEHFYSNYRTNVSGPFFGYRGSRTGEPAFLWLLPGAISWHHIHRGNAEKDPLLWA